MQSFTTHTGTAVPLRYTDVDTDQITPARFVPYFRTGGFTNILFADWRDDPSFVLNQPQYQGATILVAGRDFATGSSRESAVWALQAAGFRAVIAPRFGDIFAGNALTLGLLAAPVPQGTVDLLWQAVEEDPWVEITVDLLAQQVRCGTVSEHFEIASGARARLLAGDDLIGRTLRHESEISGYERGRRTGLPRTA